MRFLRFALIVFSGLIGALLCRLVGWRALLRLARFTAPANDRVDPLGSWLEPKELRLGAVVQTR
jgi:UPF0716 family protein affecting phage T7 exclusion